MNHWSIRLAQLGACCSIMAAVGSAAAEEVLQSTKFPLAVHYAPTHAALAAKVLAEAESAWKFQVVDQGFPAPPADAGAFGSDDYDIFIEPNPYLGLCEKQAAAPERPNGFRSRLVLDPSLPSFVLPLVLSHEFHHAIQLGVCDLGANLGESGAVYVSGVHRKGEGKNLSYFLGFNAFQSKPELALDWQGELGEHYPYGSALFWIYLDQAHGNGTPFAIYRDVLTRMSKAPALPAGACPHYLDVLREVVDLDAAYGELARWRYFAGPEDDGLHFDDLANWEGPEATEKLQSVALFSEVSTSQLPIAAATPEAPPMSLGAAYLRLSLDGLGPNDLVRLRFEGDASVRWRIETLLLREGPAIEKEHVVPASAAVEVDVAPGSAQRLVIGFVNLGDGHSDAELGNWKRAPFKYWLERVTVPDAGIGAAGSSAGGTSGDAGHLASGGSSSSSSDAGCACRATPPGTTFDGFIAALIALTVLNRRRGSSQALDRRMTPGVMEPPDAAATTRSPFCEAAFTKPMMALLDNNCSEDERKSSLGRIFIQDVQTVSHWCNRALANPERTTLDAKVAEACAPKIAEHTNKIFFDMQKSLQAFRKVHEISACKGLVVGKQTEGGACNDDAECKAGLTCRGLGDDKKTEGICRKRGLKGDACDDDHYSLDLGADHAECAAGLVCIDDKCTSPRDVGAACDRNPLCKTNHCMILGSKNTGTCAPLGKIGAKCNDELDCASARCTDGKCTERSKAGAKCKKSSDCIGVCDEKTQTCVSFCGNG